MDADKRWRDRDQRWVAPGRLFDPSRHAVDVLPDLTRPKKFIEQHHYSGTIPPVMLAVGLFGPRAQLVGVAAFTVTTSKPVEDKYGGPLARSMCELGRFVLLPDVAYNGETWFLSRAMKLLRTEYTKRQLRAIVSFADPVEWRCGQTIVKPEHWGTIYQATNAIFPRVQPKPRSDWVPVATGRPLSNRGISKLRNGRKGREYVERQMLAAGLSARRHGEDPRAWVSRLLESGELRREPHPGNLAYLFALDVGARAILRAVHGTNPYPKRLAG